MNVFAVKSIERNYTILLTSNTFYANFMIVPKKNKARAKFHQLVSFSLSLFAKNGQKWRIKWNVTTPSAAAEREDAERKSLGSSEKIFAVSKTAKLSLNLMRKKNFSHEIINTLQPKRLGVFASISSMARKNCAWKLKSVEKNLLGISALTKCFIIVYCR